VSPTATASTEFAVPLLLTYYCRVYLCTLAVLFTLALVLLPQTKTTSASAAAAIVGIDATNKAKEG
jgi:hypothetical protein